METRKGIEESRKSDEQIAEVSSSLLRYDKRVKRWRQQIQDVHDDLNFINTDRLVQIRERLRCICKEMDNA
jgi:DNA repair ATPase RecN